GFTIFLGVAEIAGGLGVASGVLTQPAALGLILIMLGAIQKKIFVWHIGFWGGNTYGWHYEIMLILMNLLIAFTNGGRWVLMKYPAQIKKNLTPLPPPSPAIQSRGYRRAAGDCPPPQSISKRIPSR